MQRLTFWAALAVSFLAVAELARPQVLLFDDTFGEDPLANGWVFNGVAQ
jgi:hypothetical protein